jgi:hypothetical protein
MDKTNKWQLRWVMGVLMVMAMMILVGCTTTDLGSLATPARIEAVTAFGAYKGAQAAISKGHADEIKSARDALLSLSQVNSSLRDQSSYLNHLVTTKTRSSIEVKATAQYQAQ